jgi:hypothetical protein
MRSESAGAGFGQIKAIASELTCTCVLDEHRACRCRALHFARNGRRNRNAVRRTARVASVEMLHGAQPVVERCRLVWKRCDSVQRSFMVWQWTQAITTAMQTATHAARNDPRASRLRSGFTQVPNTAQAHRNVRKRLADGTSVVLRATATIGV